MVIESRGPGLEARVQRLFLAQGILAERNLKIIVDRSREKTATDIDVLISEYGSGFHLTRRHAECKGGVKTHPLDRILWMRGVRELLGADSSYFIADEDDPEVAFFARRLEIDLWTLRHLEQMEGALKIPADIWPCRSEYDPFSRVRGRWSLLERDEPESRWWPLFKGAMQFVEQDSWMLPSYTRLNRLMRLLGDIGTLLKSGEIGTDAAKESARYAVSGLLVRAAQYLIFACYDVSVLQRTDIPSYLSGRLVFGDHDAAHSRTLVEGGLKLASSALEAQGAKAPHLDPARLMTPPEWKDGFTALILRLLDNSNEARYLPIAMETLQFDNSDSTKKLQRLASAVRAGGDLASLVKGFLVQALALPQELLDPIPAVKLRTSELQTASVGQLELKVEPSSPKLPKRKKPPQ